MEMIDPLVVLAACFFHFESEAPDARRAGLIAEAFPLVAEAEGRPEARLEGFAEEGAALYHEDIRRFGGELVVRNCIEDAERAGLLVRSR